MSLLSQRSMFEPGALSERSAGLGLLAVPILWLLLGFPAHSSSPKAEAISPKAQVLRFDPQSAPTIGALQRQVLALR